LAKAGGQPFAYQIVVTYQPKSASGTVIVFPDINLEPLAMPDNTLMTSDELCELSRCSSTTIWRMRQAQSFPMPRQFGRRLLWVRREIEQVLSLDT